VLSNIFVGAFGDVPSRLSETFWYCMYHSNVAWRCCVLSQSSWASSVGLDSLLMDPLGGHLVVHPASRALSMGTRSFASPHRLARWGLGLLNGDLVIRPASQTCSCGSLGVHLASQTCSCRGLIVKWVERFLGLTLGTPFLSTQHVESRVFERTKKQWNDAAWSMVIRKMRQ
jgi:hypothetical protein